jgi:hypothetical protein
MYSLNPNPAGSPFYGDIRFYNTTWNGSGYDVIDRLNIDLGGNVGIGTTAPTQKLHVNGTSRFGTYIYAGAGASSGGFIGSNVYFDGTNYVKTYAGHPVAGGWKIGNSNGGTGDINFQTSNWGTDASNLTDSTFPTRLAITSQGEVVVYGTVPTVIADGQIKMGGGRVMVGGTLSAKEIKVTTSGADYVFEDDYKLRPLAEVEQFIAEHKHLPEMMSAKAMQADGMPVSEVVTKQLAKIEELTLYAIQAQKDRDAAQAVAKATQAQVAVQEMRIQRLENLIRNLAPVTVP